MAAQEPKYQKVIDWLKENIQNGSLRAGDRLMSEAELGELFGLSRQTIRHATGELVSEGLLTRVQGSGTYIGAAAPRSAGTERSMTIAVIITFNENYIFPPTLKGIERVLSNADYTMQLYFTGNRISREARILRAILEKGNVDGLIVEPAKSALPSPNLHFYRELTARNIPILFFNAFYRELDVPCVRMDDVAAAQKMTRALIEMGHARIAGIFKADDGQGILRYEGYLKALIDAELEVSQHRVLWVDTPIMKQLGEVADYVFSRLDDSTAVLCYNDELAYALMDLAEKRGIRVPEDLSIAGIDDCFMSEMGRVPLTSIPHPKEQLGRKVAENMLKMIENPAFDGSYLFEAEPVLRQSACPPGVRERTDETGESSPV